MWFKWRKDSRFECPSHCRGLRDSNPEFLSAEFVSNPTGVSEATLARRRDGLFDDLGKEAPTGIPVSWAFRFAASNTSSLTVLKMGLTGEAYATGTHIIRFRNAVLPARPLTQ